jgi:hypothetical protein
MHYDTFQQKVDTLLESIKSTKTEKERLRLLVELYELKVEYYSQSPETYFKDRLRIATDGLLNIRDLCIDKGLV